eukprot:2154136-Prymnesium_polylepis.1
MAPLAVALWARVGAARARCWPVLGAGLGAHGSRHGTARRCSQGTEGARWGIALCRRRVLDPVD